MTALRPGEWSGRSSHRALCCPTGVPGLLATGSEVFLARRVRHEDGRTVPEQMTSLIALRNRRQGNKKLTRQAVALPATYHPVGGGIKLPPPCYLSSYMS